MTFALTKREVHVISEVLECLCGFLARYEQFPTVLDIPSSRHLYCLTMIGWLIRHKEAHSSATAEK
jgi:hypothetical protein